MKFVFPRSPKHVDVAESDWNNWTWQLRHSLKTQADFAKKFDLQPEELAAFENGKELFNVRTTPYYASLAMGPGDSIRQILMPHRYELVTEASLDSQQMQDPLAEKNNNPAPRIIHRYSDRALFLITDICSVYCRFCTRKHFTGQEQAFIKNNEYEQALEYIRQHPGLREVILSGGDPLTVSDGQLERVLADLRAIEHIEIIRIGSRMPVVCPMRITDDLVKILKKHKPVFMMSHFNHPDELTAEAAEALERLIDNGVPVMNQMVLLNGINNHPAIIQALNRRLLYLRVKPYYMFQCDPSMGTDHLRTSIEDSLEIQRELWGHLSGLAMPTFSVDIPNGGGKTSLTPNFQTAQNGQTRHYVGWDGVAATYVSPSPERIRKPYLKNYEAEWSALKEAKKS